MNNELTKEIVKDEYASAFLEVACIVAPFCNFNKVEVTKTYTPNGVDLKPSVKGFNVIDNVDVEVTTELDPNKGLQIVANYLDDNGNIVAQAKCHYSNFNWKFLMAKAKLNLKN